MPAYGRNELAPRHFLRIFETCDAPVRCLRTSVITPIAAMNGISLGSHPSGTHRFFHEMSHILFAPIKNALWKQVHYNTKHSALLKGSKHQHLACFSLDHHRHRSQHHSYVARLVAHTIISLALQPHPILQVSRASAVAAHLSQR